jgi:putative transposase
VPRHARIVLKGIAHHITQRGNYRQNIFSDDEDREKYIEFLKKYSRM